MTEEQKAEFERLSREMMKWMNENCHPHMTVIIDHTTAQLVSSEVAFTTHEYLRD